jgi:hypothetical protein
MTTSLPITILLIGLKGSGKTTFLAALWHLLEAQEIPAALRTPLLQPDREHLNGIRGRWLDLKPMVRSGLQQAQTISVNLEDGGSGQLASLVIPDISGEVFRMQWEEREVLSYYAELERNSQGAVLFLHPHDIRSSGRIGAVPSEDNEVSRGGRDTLLAEPLPELGAISSEDVHEKLDEVGGTDWDLKFSPTQVQLVDVLQNYLGFVATRPLRLSVVVSAWDLLGRADVNPETWVETHLPLLSQFLLARRVEIDSHYFGVSAQGGDLEENGLDLAKLPKPSERVLVVDGGRRHSDLTAVVKWAMPK